MSIMEQKGIEQMMLEGDDAWQWMAMDKKNVDAPRDHKKSTLS